MGRPTPLIERVLGPVDDDRWWGVAMACPWATAYHTPLWRDLSGERTEAVGVELTTGTTVVVPRMIGRGIGRLRSFVSNSDGGYGGPIAGGPVTRGEHRAVGRALDRRGFLVWTVNDNPFAPTHLRPPQRPVHDDVAWHIDLAVGDAQLTTRGSGSAPTDATSGGVENRIVATRRKEIRHRHRRAKKLGLSARAGSDHDVDAVLKMYRRTRERWRREIGRDQTPSVTRAVERALSGDDRCELLVATGGHDVVAAQFALICGRHVTSLWSMMSDEGRRQGAGIFLDLEAAERARRQGRATFDLGTSGGLAGVTDYKRDLGATPTPVVTVVHTSRAGAAVTATRNGLARLGRR
jgi:hypothetical protein